MTHFFWVECTFTDTNMTKRKCLKRIDNEIGLCRSIIGANVVFLHEKCAL